MSKQIYLLSACNILLQSPIYNSFPYILVCGVVNNMGDDFLPFLA